MGERFAAEEADGGYVCVCGWNKGICNAERLGNFFDDAEGNLDVCIGCFGAEEA